MGKIKHNQRWQKQLTNCSWVKIKHTQRWQTQLTNYSWLNKLVKQLGNALHNHWLKINQPQLVKAFTQQLGGAYTYQPLVKMFTHWVKFF